MKVELSNGEILDKLTILQIKLERIKDKEKLKNIRKEYEELTGITSSIISTDNPLYKALYDVNCKLWDIEDHIRDLELRKDFGNEFIATARSVYINNDKRADIKRKINISTSSDLMEEKSYKKY